MNSLIATLQNAPHNAYKNPEAFEKACLEQYPQISNPINYLNRLQFKMSAAEVSDLKFFLKKAYKCGLLKEPVEPEYFQPLPELA
ncbi:MAG: hypothetical protein MK132_06340 [Lentisphaerales bacterium]|nr:hypothetical protein [Lentisphaerales bacterium]